MQRRQYKVMQSLCCILVILTLSFAASLHQVELDEQHHQHQCHLFHIAQYWLPSADFVWPIIVQSVDPYIPLNITFISIIGFAANARAPPAHL